MNYSHFRLYQLHQVPIVRFNSLGYVRLISNTQMFKNLHRLENFRKRKIIKVSFQRNLKAVRINLTTTIS